MFDEQILVEPDAAIAPDTDNDPTRCYVCGEKATAVCGRCKLAVCEEHQQKEREPVTKISMILCDECADYYDGLVRPD
ncbi:hypothetical protein EPA93_17050 [Ktedonosporobacter rubrisoli]|uniref:Uncharacterized protein n=1 Tax=Ktedonosporobacter rubrisoli TaxID=2509675 RepID=A0A4P6JQB2_KTERU|nr:hypothetical protein [Ktedonosporobacter rubrisoli]QBD77607.1 hypothetical protein EPA93_17050 [Ktedonosporobacter rubrisoli]